MRTAKISQFRCQKSEKNAETSVLGLQGMHEILITDSHDANDETKTIEIVNELCSEGLKDFTKKRLQR